MSDMRTGPKPRAIIDRLLAKCAPPNENGCVIWTGTLDSDGYGRLWVGSRTDNSRRPALAHRLAYELFVGPVPGLQLDHVRSRGCRSRACVNPDHLEPVTRRENVLRSFCPPAQNARKTHCIHGHEFTPENTYVYPSGRRGCRSCKRSSDTRRRDP